MVSRFHLCDDPSVVSDLDHGVANSSPVVVAQKEVRIHAFVPTSPPMLEYIFDMDAGNPRAVYLNPLLGKPGVVDVAHIEVNADPGTIHFIQESVELAGAQKKPLL